MNNDHSSARERGQAPAGQPNHGAGGQRVCTLRRSPPQRPEGLGAHHDRWAGGRLDVPGTPDVRRTDPAGGEGGQLRPVPGRGS